MAEKTDFYVEGYRFGSLEDVEKAQTEQKKAAYFAARLEGKSVQNILAVYDKILDERIFSTPVGWEYLRQLQEQLKDGGVPKERIRPIPMYVSFSHEQTDTADHVRQRIRPAKKRNTSEDRLKLSVIVNILFGVLILAMFAIAMNSKNPNILNYRKTIVNEYAAWEQELSEREQQIKQKEAELFTD